MSDKPKKLHDWKYDGLSPHNGEYWYKCTQCGKSDWLAYSQEPTPDWHGECPGKTKTVIDSVASSAAATEAIQAAGDAASPEWKDNAKQWILYLANTKPSFTTDDLWVNVPKPPEPRALGALMRELSKAGLIEKTGAYIMTSQVLRHRAPIAVWRKK